MNNRLVRTVALGAGVAIGATVSFLVYANRRLFLVNDVTTGESLAYPGLQSRVYYATAADALAAATHSIRALPGWRVVRAADYDSPVIGGRREDSLDAEVETFGGLLDDVTVFVQPLTLGQTRVTIRSRSRQGRGDLGSNAHHIRLLQDAMDRRLMVGAAI